MRAIIRDWNSCYRCNIKGQSEFLQNCAGAPQMPELSEIDFSNSSEIHELVKERHHYVFGVSDDGFIDEYMDAVESLFSGNSPDYQAMDTAYHDLSHTMQATLCLVELIFNRHQKNISPEISAKDFKRALVAVLMHDIGFLKKVGDTDGTGAKYTHLHEKRSCEFARKFLQKRGWSDDDVQFVENLISSTGPRADLTKIKYRSEIERLLGQIVCTSDFIGQMSDPRYPDRLKPLFNEFEENYRYQQIPRSQWPFKSYEDLLSGTPGFWKHFVLPKLNGECEGVWLHLENPVTAQNPHIESLSRNLDTIRQMIAEANLQTG
jgi:hypothetical protein